MKKSKFLQNSKDMLSRSFNPTKCKISLRLAASRLKLLRNKKEVQVKQMKREIARLLESGQDQTAKIRVEHVIREEKIMGAYDLLDIYCELIVARLPIIETQKNCPIDMKEAIASIVFASPRCGDVPELLDVRKQFSAKYGKEFITAAIEIRPQCGVSRLLVEKLSATAPDGQTKIKILSAIAEEHNVNWDPEAFEEKRSGGPSSIKKENELYSDPPRFEDTEVHAHSSSNANSLPLNSAQQDAKFAVGAENLPPAQTSGANTTFEPKAGPAGQEMPQLFKGDTHSSHLNGQRWNMEFKDSASAARAAAESAERASMAARAAAEISIHGRVLGQYSTESHKSDAYTLKGDGLETPPNLNSFEIVSEASVNKLSSECTRLGNKQIDGTKPSNPMTSTRSDVTRFDVSGSKKHSQAGLLKSKATADDDSLCHGVPSVHENAQENSSKEEAEMVMRKQSFSYENENENSGPDKVENLREGMIGKHKSFSSSYSQSGTSDYINMFANYEEQKFEIDIGEDPSVSISETVIHDEAPETSSHDFLTATFDQSDTESDDLELDRGPVYDEQDLEFHLYSLGQKSPERTSINIDSWNPRSSSNNTVESDSPPSYFMRESSFTDISGNAALKEDSVLDSTPAVRFDDSDGPSSEGDYDRNASRVEDSGDLSHESDERGQLVNLQFEEKTVLSVGSPSKTKGSLSFGIKQLSLSSDDELSSSDETQWKGSQVNVFGADLKPSAKHPSSGSKTSLTESNNIGNESDRESGEELNFEKLTGGLRHKGHNHLSFFKSRLDASSSCEKETETTTKNTSSTTPSLVEHHGIGTMPEHKTTSTTHNLHSELDSDNSEEEEEEEYLQKSSGLKQSSSAVSFKTKLALGSSNSAFCSDDSDLDEHPPRELITRKSHLRGGISRRTKASPSSSIKNSNPKMHLRSDVDRKPTTPHETEIPKRDESYRRNFGMPEKYEQTISGMTSVPAESNTWGSTEQPDSWKTYPTKQESEERFKSGVHELVNSLGKQSSSFYAPDNQREFQPRSGKSSRLGESKQQIPAELANPQQKANAGAGVSFAGENPKASSLDKHSLNKTDSAKKASHVHPKLPDYDALVQSLRTNRS